MPVLLCAVHIVDKATELEAERQDICLPRTVLVRPNKRLGPTQSANASGIRPNYGGTRLCAVTTGQLFEETTHDARALASRKWCSAGVRVPVHHSPRTATLPGLVDHLCAHNMPRAN